MTAPRRWAAAGWLLGWAAGWLLGWRLPALRRPVTASAPTGPAEELPAAVIVPARDEARTLGALLDSLADQDPRPREVVVVDDGSTDDTAAVAEARGLRVVTAGALPDGWTGKTWACAAGVAATTAPLLVLLDADVRLAPGSLAALVDQHSRLGGLLSVLPEHRPQRPYEQLSAPFNLVSVMGSGAAVPGSQGRTTLAFGPCLVVERADLAAVGGFDAVAGEVVEDLALADRFARRGLPVHARAGGPLVWFRMYPDGLAHLCEGWTKNMAAGAAALPPGRSALVALWVTSALGPAMAVVTGRRSRWTALLAVCASGAQLAVLSRRLGRFRWWIGPAQPLVMAVFTALFGRSLWHRVGRRRTGWKGRTVRL